MNNSGEVQTTMDTPLDLTGPGLKAMSTVEKRADPAFEQPGLIPFDPDMWDSWSD